MIIIIQAVKPATKTMKPTKKKSKKITNPLAEAMEIIKSELAPKVVKTYKLKPEWKEKFQELNNKKDKMMKDMIEAENEARKLWKAIEISTKDKRNMRYNEEKKVIEVTK